ncbi:MAG: STAS domain-containing protein [Gammaproteobacteria bacterium]|jgi:anti-anti-sigma factor
MTKGRILGGTHGGVYVLKFAGDVRVTLCSTVDAFLDKMFADNTFRSILVDLTETEGIDSTSLGLLAKLSLRAKDRFGIVPTLVSTRPDITRILISMGLDGVYQLIKEPLEHEEQLSELKPKKSTEEDVRRQVLEAHRALMSLNDANRETFEDLVSTLEGSSGTG